jgi:hypothetical protein
MNWSVKKYDRSKYENDAERFGGDLASMYSNEGS